MFVKCEMKTSEGKILEFILNTESIVVIEKIIEGFKIILHLNTGCFSWEYDSLSITNEILHGFGYLLNKSASWSSPNLSLLIL